METIKERPVSMNTVSVGGILDDIKTQTRRVIKPQPDYSILKNGITLESHKCPVLGPVHLGHREWGLYGSPYKPNDVPCFAYNCPYGKIGERLWVKETWRETKDRTGVESYPKIEYRADYKGMKNTGKWKPLIFMFRKYSRILLEITHLRIEQIQDISDKDILAEGVKIRMKDGIVLIDLASDITGLLPKRDFHSAAYSTSEILRAFMGQLWNSINAKPKPVMSGKKIVSYISYPWDEIRETRDHRGLKWIVYGNPHVWAVTFKVLKKEV